MTDLDPRRPEFTIAESGYDRAQVDAYVGRLQRLVADAEERARNAEAEYVFDQHAAIGPRIAEIFALAEAEARELRERYSAEGAGLISEARIKARAIIDAAEHAASELRERVEQDQRAMLTELEQDRERIHGEVNVLELRKGEALAELSRLSDLLGEATASREAAAPLETTAPPEKTTPPETATPREATVAADPPTETLRVKRARPDSIGPSDETVEFPAVKASANKRRRPPRTQPRTSPKTSD